MIKRDMKLHERLILFMKSLMCRHPRIIYYLKGQIYIPFILLVVHLFPRPTDIWVIVFFAQLVTTYLFWDIDFKIFTSHSKKDKECLQT